MLITTCIAIQGNTQGQYLRQGPSSIVLGLGFSSSIRPPKAWARNSMNNCKQPQTSWVLPVDLV